MAIQTKPIQSFADFPGVACTQEAMIVLSNEYSEVASEEITPGTIARLTRLLTQQHQHLKSMTLLANGGHDSF